MSIANQQHPAKSSARAPTGAERFDVVAPSEFIWLGHAAADGWGDNAKLGHKLGKGSGLERLRAVGEGMVGVVWDFDEEAVGACCYCSAGHRRNFVAAAGAVRRV